MVVSEVTGSPAKVNTGAVDERVVLSKSIPVPDNPVIVPPTRLAVQTVVAAPIAVGSVHVTVAPVACPVPLDVTVISQVCENPAAPDTAAVLPHPAESAKFPFAHAVPPLAMNKAPRIFPAIFPCAPVPTSTTPAASRESPVSSAPDVAVADVQE